MKSNKIGKRLAFLAVLFSISFTCTTNIETRNYKVAREIQFTGMCDPVGDNIVLDETAYSNLDYVNAIYENQNIEQDQKEILVQLVDYLSKNPYVDKEHVVYMLSNLKVKVVDESVLTKQGAGAYYNPTTNEIFVGKSNYGLLHEALHATTDYYLTREEFDQLYDNKQYSIIQGFYDNRDFNDEIANIEVGTYEGMTTIIDYEYFDGPDSYGCITIFAKMLCEVLGNNTMLEAYTTDNINILINKLEYLLGDRDKAIDVISTINDIRKDIHSGKTRDEYRYKILKVTQYINECSVKALGRTMYEDEVLRAYFKQLVSDTKTRVYKAYYSEKYENELGRPYISNVKRVIEVVYTRKSTGEKVMATKITSYVENKSYIDKIKKPHESRKTLVCLK